MKYFLLALNCMILLYACSAKNVAADPDSSVMYERFQKMLESKDSANAEKLKNELIMKYPDSKETFEFAVEDFYAKLYPAWTDDSLKVIIIKDLMKKYKTTTWRRTMYQYLINSISAIKNLTEMDKYLDSFIEEFPEDYLPYTTSARYHYIDCGDTVKALDCAMTGYSYCRNYPKLDHYFTKEWELEKRSAPISAVSYLAEILIDKKEYEKAVSVLYDVIDNIVLGTDDETTLCKPYYLLGKAFFKKGDKDKAKTYFAKCLIEGDSWKVWSLCDSLYSEVSKLKTSPEILEDIRKSSGFSELVYNDITETEGLKNITASRVAWGDYDSDGYQDMLLDGRRLLKNLSGKGFYDISSLAFPDTNAANGGLWADLDNDGDLDIFTKDPETVRLNDSGVFKRSHDYIRDNGISTEGAGMADFDRDGYIDVYLANYENSSGFERDQIFFGRENHMSDETASSGILPSDDKNRAGRGVSASDFDSDGDNDIYVSNYRLTDNFLLQNSGTGNFSHIAKEKNVPGIETEAWYGHTIGSEWGDIDNDGDLDLVTANLAHPRYIDFSNMTMLYENSGAPDFKFTDIRRSAGIRYYETHSEPAFGDLNNDGFLDLYINCVYENRRSFLYLNNGNKTFKDITYLSGTRHFNGWGVAFADIDNDGDLDILAAGGNVQLFRNDTPKIGNWLEVKVTGKDHSDAIGTRLKLFNETVSLIREIQGGKGSTNQHSLVQHFGLGREFNHFKLEVTFPSGTKRTVDVPEVNRIITIRE
ncbi:MAG TPA: FG-GAP-like repeat-containing protein [Clostridiales bacterium]|nr:FG-GAP-like repeat-containing protein [Clostridiales bacterium]HQP70289.1 FG-GAP-like repeat-containing protein [Clostridiales bacterium]